LWESPDGQYAVVGTWDEAAVYDRPEVSLVTISTGEATLLPDPVLTEVYGLSPDGSRLAYSTPGAVNVYNLARGTRRVVLEAPCANYGPGWTVCGEIESGVWIDPQTLLVAHFAGSMPKELECEFGGLCEEPDADTYSIVDIRGHVVAQAPIPTDGPCSEWAGDLTDVRGSTVVLGDPPRCTFNLDDLSAGVVEPAPTTG
jgi:hypothetical protein